MGKVIRTVILMLASSRSIFRLTMRLGHSFAPKEKPAPPVPAAAKPEEPENQVVTINAPLRLLNVKEQEHMLTLERDLLPSQKRRIESLAQKILSLQIPTFLHYLVRNYNYSDLKVTGKTQFSPEELKYPLVELRQFYQSLQVLKVPNTEQISESAEEAKEKVVDKANQKRKK